MIYAFVSYLRDIDLVLFHAINFFCGQTLMVDHILDELASII